MENDDLKSADLLLSVCAELSPEVAEKAEQVAPFIRLLFSALADGHTFIEVNGEEKALLEQAEPMVGFGKNISPLILHGNRLFFGRYWQLENALVDEIRRLQSHELNDDEIATPKRISFLQQWFQTAGSENQQVAVALALLKNMLLISGGPGTGKTSSIAKLLALLCIDEAVLPKIALVAPTGKASARMSEALQKALGEIDGLPESVLQHLQSLQGKTVHRLLGLRPPQMLPRYHAHSRLAYDVVVVDEASMLDSYLFWQLLCALPDGCRVILLGDENQLPSVGVGAVLSALADDSTVLPETVQNLRKLLPEMRDFPTLGEHTARLNISHRFDENSGIGQLANAVVQGNAQLAWQQFALFPQELSIGKGHLLQDLYELHQPYWQAIDAQDVEQAFVQQQKIMVLTALKSDADEINRLYRQFLQQKGRVQAQAQWFVGQTIIITRNESEQKLYNGDVGIIMQQGTDLKAVFQEGKQKRCVPLSLLPQHETAFAITVHKSQGSEYEQVWLQAPQEANVNYNRALLYTAITRAQAKFVYWGDQASLEEACQNKQKRRSAVAGLLRNNKNE